MLEHQTNSLPLRYFKLAIVNILSNLMVPLASLVDLAFLGHLPDIKYLAGIGLATILFDYLYRTLKFVRMGTTGLTAQAEGANDKDEVLLTLLRNSLIALSLGLLLLLLQYPIEKLGFSFLGAAPDVKVAGEEYYVGRIWGAPAVLINWVLIGWFLGREQNKKVLIMSIIGNLINIVLDYIFIIHLQWNSFGAGAATAASQYVALLIGLIFVVSEQWSNLIPSVLEKMFDWNAFRSVFNLNRDLWLRTFLGVTVYAIFINLSSIFGSDILASNSLLIEMVGLSIFFVEGASFATESLVGTLSGSGDKQGLIPLMRLSVAFTISLGTGFVIAVFNWPNSLLGLLTNHLEIIEQTKQYIYWLLPMVLGSAIVYTLEGYFLGITNASPIMKAMLVGMIIAFLPGMVVAFLPGIVFGLRLNIQLLWLSLVLFACVRASVLAVLAYTSIQEDMVTE